MDQNQEIQFVAIIKKTEGKVSVTGDKEYRIMVATENPIVMQAGTWSSHETVTVIIKRNSYHGLGDPSTI